MGRYAWRCGPHRNGLRDALTINASLLKEGRTAISHETKCSPLKKPQTIGGVIAQPGGGGGGTVATTDEVASILVDRARLVARPSAAALNALLLTLGPTTIVGMHPGSAYPGSVNAKVIVQGTTLGGSRFVRTTTRSVRVG